MSPADDPVTPPAEDTAVALALQDGAKRVPAPVARASLAALAQRREELLSITALQRRRLAIEAASLAALCDPMVQGARLWKGMKQHPAVALLLPLLTLLTWRSKGPARPAGLARRAMGLWRLCSRSWGT